MSQIQGTVINTAIKVVVSEHCVAFYRNTSCFFIHNPFWSAQKPSEKKKLLNTSCVPGTVLSLLYSSFHLFIHQIFTDWLLCARSSSKPREYYRGQYYRGHPSCNSYFSGGLFGWLVVITDNR